MASAYDLITDRILASLNKGDIPWRKPWTTSRPMNLDGRNYQGINAIVLGMSEYSDPRWLTYRKATSLGGHVIKGEKATPIVFWKHIEKDDKSESFWLLRYYSVFNVEQTKGLELPALDQPNGKHEPINRAESIISNMPNRPAIKHDGGNQAFYRPSTDSIHLPSESTFHGPETYYSTLFHEASHSTGHESRLNRHGMETGIAAFGSATYSKEELVAEFGAAFLCHESGFINTIENSAAYIQGWSRAIGKDKRLVITAASLGEKAANYIMGVN